MRGNDMLSKMLGKQFQSINGNWLQTYCTSHINALRLLIHNTQIQDTLWSKQFIRESVNLFETMMLELFINPSQLPEVIRLNCYYLFNSLEETLPISGTQDQQVKLHEINKKRIEILSKISGYVFLRFINPYFNTLVDSKKLNITDEQRIILKQLVIKGTASMQKLTNKLGNLLLLEAGKDIEFVTGDYADVWNKEMTLLVNRQLKSPKDRTQMISWPERCSVFLEELSATKPVIQWSETVCGNNQTLERMLKTDLQDPTIISLLPNSYSNALAKNRTSSIIESKLAKAVTDKQVEQVKSQLNINITDINTALLVAYQQFQNVNIMQSGLNTEWTILDILIEHFIKLAKPTYELISLPKADGPDRVAAADLAKFFMAIYHLNLAYNNNQGTAVHDFQNAVNHQQTFIKLWMSRKIPASEAAKYNLQDASILFDAFQTHVINGPDTVTMTSNVYGSAVAAACAPIIPSRKKEDKKAKHTSVGTPQVGANQYDTSVLRTPVSKASKRNPVQHLDFGTPDQRAPTSVSVQDLSKPTLNGAAFFGDSSSDDESDSKDRLRSSRRHSADRLNSPSKRNSLSTGKTPDTPSTGDTPKLTLTKLTPSKLF